MKNCIIIILLIFSPNLFAQTLLTGKVINSQGQSIDNFSVSLWSDTTLVKGNLFFDGQFSMLANPQTYILKVSSTIYLPYQANITVADGIQDLGTIVLNDLELQGVTVMGRRPVLKIELGVVKCNVQNSFLKDVGSVGDVLNYLPGVYTKPDGGIALMEGGKPIIYVNKRKINSAKELSMIRSSDVESVEIQSNPSAEHDATGAAIIYIITKQNFNDFLGLDVSNSLYIKRRPADIVNIGVRNKIGKMSNFLSYSYAYIKMLQFDVNTQSVFMSTNTIQNNRETRMDNFRRSHQLFYSFQYDINNKNTFGIQYSLDVDRSLFDKTNTQQYRNTATNTELFHNIDIEDRGKNYLHNISLNYDWEISKVSSLDFVWDYAVTKNNLDEQILEQSSTDNFIAVQSQDKYNVMGVRTNFNTKLALFNLKSGLSFSTINNKAGYNYNTLVRDNDLKDNIVAVYSTINKNVAKWSVDVGLRVERTQAMVSLSEFERAVIDTSYINFFPNLGVSRKFSDKMGVSLAYNKQITRPGFSQLNPRFNYLDLISYSIGNPSLLPTISNRFSLNFNLSKFSAGLSYRNYSNIIAFIGEEEKDISIGKLLRYSFTNIKKAQYLTWNLTYNYNIKGLAATAYVSFSKPYITDEFNNFLPNKPLYQTKLNADYAIGKTTSIFTALYYRSEGDYDLLHFYSSGTLMIGVSQYFFNKKMQVSVRANDIFKTDRSNTWQTTYGNIESNMSSDGDTQSLMFMIKYNLGTLKTNSNKKSANSESLNRL